MYIWKNKRSLGLILCSMIFIFSCQNEVINPDQSYSFFVAGHTYGQPWIDHIGLYPPFQQKFDLINTRNSSLGFLTGDIVKKGTEKNWNEVDSVLTYLDAKVFYIVGNHDLTDRELFENRYGRAYFSFKKHKDLFIILDPNMDHWNISGMQLDFLKETLMNTADTRNIFVFFHQLLWWDKNNKYQFVRMNSMEGRADTINFWDEIIPLFKEIKKPVAMFAGDMGAVNWSDSYTYDFDSILNITFIGSGMGNEDSDNFIIAHVSDSGCVDYELIALNGDDIHALGKLEDYQLPTEYPIKKEWLNYGD